MLAPWKKAMTNIDSILKSNANKGPSSQSYGFSSSHVWMWDLDLKKAEPRRTDAFELVLEKIHDSPLDFKEIQPSILKEKCFEYSLEGLMLKLKLQYFGHLMPRSDSLEKTLMLGKIEGRRRRRRQRMRWLNSITDSLDMSSSKLLVMVESRGAWPAAVHGVAKSLRHNWASEQHNNLTLIHSPLLSPLIP